MMFVVRKKGDVLSKMVFLQDGMLGYLSESGTPCGPHFYSVLRVF